MQDLPTALRMLADICEANGGHLPETLTPIVPKKPRAKRTDKPSSLAKAIVKKHFYQKL